MRYPALSHFLPREQKFIWHPCMQMKDLEVCPPLQVDGCFGNEIKLANGKTVIDAISSWWCKTLGHGHPRLKAALLKQMETLEHVILANTTCDVVEALSEKLCQLSPSFSKVLYASDGSSAVEIALKLCLHAQLLLGCPQKTHFLSLPNSYHGETVGALSVSDVDLYKKHYHPLLFKTEFLPSLPYVSNTQDPLWQNCAKYWDSIEAFLEQRKSTLAAIVIEPIVQAAAGMKIYSQDFLKRLRAWTRENQIFLIADEIMTGIGRTGKMLACHHAGIEPDVICLGKGLTSGWLPLSAVVTTEAIYHLFYDDYVKGKTFFHSHTFSGNALAAAVALETLRIIEEENICHKVALLETHMAKAFSEVMNATSRLENLRYIGGIVAADLISNDKKRRLGFEFYQKAIQYGALMRPLGNTLYWTPPLNMDDATLQKLKEITIKAILALPP